MNNVSGPKAFAAGKRQTQEIESFPACAATPSLGSNARIGWLTGGSWVSAAASSTVAIQLIATHGSRVSTDSY